MKKAIKLNKNNANFLTTIIIKCENGGGGCEAVIIKLISAQLIWLPPVAA